MTDQIKSRISNYLKRIAKENSNMGLYVRPCKDNSMQYSIICNGKKQGSDTIENILNINALEAIALSAMGKSKEQAKADVEEWLRRGLADAATELNTQTESVALFIHGAPEDPAYILYLNGRPNKSIDLIETVKKYQHG